MNLNKAMILGNLTRDPESKTTPSGQTVTTFGIATNRFYTDQQKQRQQKVEFHNVVAWGRLGEICAQYLKRGQLAFVEGRIETRTWDAPDGTKNSVPRSLRKICKWDPRQEGAPSAGGYAPSHSSSEEDVPIVEDEIQVKDIPF